MWKYYRSSRLARQCWLCCAINILVLLLCVGCTAEPVSEPAEPEYTVSEPMLSERFVWETADYPGIVQARVITDTQTDREYLFYKVGDSAGLTALLPAELEQEEQEEPTEPAPEPTEPVRYPLTDEERRLVNEVVMAESGNQPYCGQMGVAQCLLNDCERSGIRPAEAVLEYQYTPNRVEPSESVQKAVSAVFDRGEVVTDEVILWFYAPDRVDGTPWHESQRHVLTINDHKFFAEKE